MDWTKLLDAFLSGSPWAFVFVTGYAFWRVKGEYDKLIAQKDRFIQDRDTRIQELNETCKQTVIDTSMRIEEVLQNAHDENAKLQERRTNEIVEMQKEAVTTMSKLNATLGGLVEAIRRGDSR